MTVVAARVFAVEEARIDSGVSRGVVRLRREDQAQQHSPDCHRQLVEPFD